MTFTLQIQGTHGILHNDTGSGYHHFFEDSPEKLEKESRKLIKKLGFKEYTLMIQYSKVNNNS